MHELTIFIIVLSHKYLVRSTNVLCNMYNCFLVCFSFRHSSSGTSIQRTNQDHHSHCKINLVILPLFDIYRISNLELDLHPLLCFWWHRSVVWFIIIQYTLKKICSFFSYQNKLLGKRVKQIVSTDAMFQSWWLFAPQPLAARGIVMIITEGHASIAGRWAGGQTDEFCLSWSSAPIIQNHLKSIYVNLIL